MRWIVRLDQTEVNDWGDRVSIVAIEFSNAVAVCTFEISGLSVSVCEFYQFHCSVPLRSFQYQVIEEPGKNYHSLHGIRDYSPSGLSSFLRLHTFKR